MSIFDEHGFNIRNLLKQVLIGVFRFSQLFIKLSKKETLRMNISNANFFRLQLVVAVEQELLKELASFIVFKKFSFNTNSLSDSCRYLQELQWNLLHMIVRDLSHFDEFMVPIRLGQVQIQVCRLSHFLK